MVAAVVAAVVTAVAAAAVAAVVAAAVAAVVAVVAAAVVAVVAVVAVAAVVAVVAAAVVVVVAAAVVAVVAVVAAEVVDAVARRWESSASWLHAAATDIGWSALSGVTRGTTWTTSFAAEDTVRETTGRCCRFPVWVYRPTYPRVICALSSRRAAR